jgi:transposase-like protein
MIQLLEKGEQNPSQISRDHHVTRSLLYVWWQLYQERGEAAFVPTQAFPRPPEIDRPQHAQDQIAHLERLCGQQALELERLAIGGRCAKKSLALGLATGFHPSRDTLSLNGFGSRCRTFQYENSVASWESIGSGTPSTVVRQLTRNTISGCVLPYRKFVKSRLSMAIVV